MGDVANKVAYFQAITGIDDADLCTEILSAHNWDLELAIASITAGETTRASSSSSTAPDVSASTPLVAGISRETHDVGLAVPSNGNNSPGLAWRVITLPFSIISASLGLVSGAVGLGLWAASGVLSYSLSVVGLSGRDRGASAPLVNVSQSVLEATEFVNSFENDYGRLRPNFVIEGFMDALQRSRREYKLLFVYLHSPEHPDTPVFCQGSLCNEILVAFLNENFVSWGASVKASEGFKMSNSLKASRFPFGLSSWPQQIRGSHYCNRHVEGPQSPDEMISTLQGVLDESAPVLVSARIEAEERRNNMRLREEQDAEYRVALEADQARERQRIEEQERLELEAAEVERKRKEEEEARERLAKELAQKEAALAKLRQEKALSLGAEPEKGPNVTQVLVRFPSGERKERRFHSESTIQSLYDYVDSLGSLELNCYTLVSNFPRTVYGEDKLSLTLNEAGLHPQASLFVELN